jgi:predicted dehydrogenase
MHERLRCAVIGTGAFGLDHLNSLLHSPRATAVALAEVNAERLREAAERFKIARSYSDYHDLLDQPDIDAVTIAVPNYLHARIAIDALQARKHVLVEKPMAMNAKEAAKVVETAKRMKRTLMVAQNFRFNRHTQVAKVIVERGDLGEVYHARCFWLRRAGIPRVGSWFTRKQFSGGGSLVDLGVHMLDTCLHLLGEFEVKTVSAQTFARFGPRGLGEMDWGKSEIDPKKPFDVDDLCVALIRLKSGHTVSLECAWAGHHAPDAREYGIDLLGTSAGLTLYPARLFRPGPNGFETIHLSLPVVQHSEDRIHHFVGCALEGKKPLVAPEQSFKVQEVIDAIHASAASGKEVKLD